MVVIARGSCHRMNTTFLQAPRHEEQHRISCSAGQIARLFTGTEAALVIIQARSLGFSWRGKHTLPCRHKVFPALMRKNRRCSVWVFKAANEGKEVSAILYLPLIFNFSLALRRASQEEPGVLDERFLHTSWCKSVSHSQS